MNRFMGCFGQRFLLVAYAAIFAVAVAPAVWYAAREEKSGDGSRETVAHAEKGYCDYEARRVACVRRFEARIRIANKVFEGRLSLFEAADRYRDLNETNADFHWYGFRHLYSGDSDDERICRQVIKVAICLPGKDVRQIAIVKERLETELYEHLRSGSHRLPR